MNLVVNYEGKYAGWTIRRLCGASPSQILVNQRFNPLTAIRKMTDISHFAYYRSDVVR